MTGGNATLVWDGERCDRIGSIIDGGEAVARRAKHAMPRMLSQNRLIEVKDGTTTVATYTYDYLGRRISKTAAGTITRYMYDGWNVIADYTTQNSTLKIQNSYTWGMDLSGSMHADDRQGVQAFQSAGGVGGLLAVNELSILNSQLSITSFFPTYDGNGNVSEYLDTTGTVVAHYEYDPFGNTTVATGLIGKFLRKAGMKVDKSDHSNAGTVGVTNWNYICPGGKPYVGHPWSKEVLDKEANEYAEKCCKKREYCGKKICVVMIAPKTATLPPKSSCCNIDISVWWDPYDPVPNQVVRGGAVKESQKHWSKYGIAYPVQSKKFGLLGNHAFQPFMQSNPMYQPDWKPDVMELAGGRRPLSGKNAPNPMDVIRRYKSSCDITIVCHSQGCNMVMAVLNRGCKK